TAMGHLLGARVPRWVRPVRRFAGHLASVVAIVVVAVVLTQVWEPLGPQHGFVRNAIFVVLLLGGLLGALVAFQFAYRPILRFSLNHKAVFLSLPVLLVLGGASVWLGFDRVFGFVPAAAHVVGV